MRNLWWLKDKLYDKEKSEVACTCDWITLSRDENKAIDFDQSSFFQLIYQNEFDRPGGEPCGVLIGDYEITNGYTKGTIYNDIDTLKEISKVAAASFSPFISSASANLFGADSFADLGYYFDLYNQFEQVEYVKWRSFRQMEDSRFVGLVFSCAGAYPYKNDGTRNQDLLSRTNNCPETEMLWAMRLSVCIGLVSLLESGWFVKFVVSVGFCISSYEKLLFDRFLQKEE